MKKCLAAMVATLALVFGLAVPCVALAEEAQPLGDVSVELEVDSSSLSDADELLAGYFEQQLFGDSGIELAGEYGESKLSGNSLLIYRQLKEAVQSIAAGSASSTKVTIDTSGFDDGTRIYYTAEDLGVDSLVSSTDSSSLSSEATSALVAKTFDFDLVYQTLLADCPYDLYWHSKTSGVGANYSLSGKSKNGELVSVAIKGISVYFSPDSAYKGSSDYTVDTTKTSAASAAATTAKSIVESYADKTDYEKLVAYKEKICDLVSYNSSAASSGSSTAGTDPWQVIYVFDGDTSTNVVCEGYAKAFQYLCDLTEFKNDIECYTVTGTMTGATGAGGHMWNIVRVSDSGYLVDVTNCDSGTVGCSDKLFLVGGPSGSWSGTYTFAVGSSSVAYAYYDDTESLYGETILTIADSNCSKFADPAAVDISGSVVALSPASATYTGSAIKPTATVTLDGKMLTQGTDYTISYSNNTNAGTATVTVTGKGNYTGTVTKPFAIAKASIASATMSSIASQASTGSALTPKPTITLGGKTLAEGTDYTLSYSDNVNPGTATVTATGAGNYTGSCSTTFTITCSHSWGSWTVTKTATCTTAGSKTRTCSACGVTETQTVAATGHSYGGWTTKAATCTTSGSKTRTCSACGVTETQTIAATGHSYGGWTTKAATCTTSGSKTRTCSACGVTETQTIAATGHTWGSWTTTKAATALTAGSKTRTCSTCGYKQVQTIAAGGLSVSYTTHVQDYGWQSWVSNGATAGTVGKSKRLEGLKITLKGNNGTSVSGSSIQYRTHIQDIGWQGWKSDGALSGTTGKSKRLEAMCIRLTGEAAQKYDVYYRVHAQDYGWLGWAKNGEAAGTEGQSKRLEGLQVVLVEKGGAAPGSTSGAFVPYLSGSAHVQDIGWSTSYTKSSSAKLSLGTTGKSKRVEGIKINASALKAAGYSGSIRYRAHVQDIGWQGWKYDGAMAGTSGKSKRLEAVKIELTGDLAEDYDVYYRVHAQDYGWLGWAKNGEAAGTEGKSKRLESVQVVLVPKGSAAPGSTSGAFIS